MDAVDVTLRYGPGECLYFGLPVPIKALCQFLLRRGYYGFAEVWPGDEDEQHVEALLREIGALP
jgi:hypothetical protein